MGKHLAIALDRPYYLLYRQHYDAHELMAGVLLLIRPSDSKSATMHACTRPPVQRRLSSQCPRLLAYEREHFSAIGDKLVFQYTSIKLDRTDYYVVGNKLYTCMVLPRGERVTSQSTQEGQCDVIASRVMTLWGVVMTWVWMTS